MPVRRGRFIGIAPAVIGKYCRPCTSDLSELTRPPLSKKSPLSVVPDSGANAKSIEFIPMAIFIDGEQLKAGARSCAEKCKLCGHPSGLL
jgi:hypothetical protein